MQEAILIYLNPADVDHPEVSDQRNESLASLCATKQVIVIVPAEDVLLLSVDLPRMNSHRLKQAVPFALEDQLIDEVESLHFALGARQTEGLPVAIVANEKMQMWMTQLKTWDVTPNQMVPASLALPFVPGEWTIAIVDDQCVVRTGLCQGWAGERENLSFCLALAFDQAASKPSAIRITNYTEHKLLPLPFNSVVEDRRARNQWITDLMTSMNTMATINLLQGAYSTKKFQVGSFKKVTQWAAYFAITWIVLLFLTPMISSAILQKHVDQLAVKIRQIYLEQFPTATAVIAPRLRMEEKLHQLLAKEGDSRLLQWLTLVGSGMTQVTGIQLKEFTFQNNQLVLSIVAMSSDKATALITFLSQQGLQVKQQNATLAEDKLNTTLVLENKS